MTTIPKGRRLVGAERATLARDLVQRYTDGASIRDLAAETGRSYGAIHRLLTEGGAELRERGKARTTRHTDTANVREDLP